MRHYMDSYVFLTANEVKVFKELKLPVLRFKEGGNHTFRWIMALSGGWGSSFASVEEAQIYCKELPKYYFNKKLSLALASIYMLVIEPALGDTGSSLTPLCMQYKSIAEELYKELK